MPPPPLHPQVKDFMLLLCLALDHCGYHTAAIREILVTGEWLMRPLLTTVAVPPAFPGLVYSNLYQQLCRLFRSLSHTFSI